MNNKIFGYFLLLFGLIIICSALFSSYNIFTARSDPPEFFKTEEDLPFDIKKEEMQLTPKAIEEEMERIIGEQLKEVLPVDAFSVILNLIIWSIFAGILIFGGAQISGIGIKLIKTHEKRQEN